MSVMRADAVVLGAGIVGVSIALHLQKRGRQVVLIDRRKPGEETSFGNAGLIQSEGIFLKRREVRRSIRKSYNHHLREQSCT